MPAHTELRELAGCNFEFGFADHGVEEEAVTESLLESSPPDPADRLGQATLQAALAEKLESFQAQIAALHEQADDPEDMLKPGTATW